MSSLARHSASTADLAPAGDSSQLEPGESDYCREVLQLPAGKTEAMAEEELVARANALGISTPQPLTDEKRNTSSAESSSTVITFHVRTFSSASNDSASTDLTTHSSILDGPSPPIRAPAGLRRRSKSMSFSQYDKYLANIDPNINQPKFVKEPSPDRMDASAQSLFSVSTKRSLFSIKRGIKSRIRWRKKSAPSANVTVWVLLDSIARC